MIPTGAMSFMEMKSRGSGDIEIEHPLSQLPSTSQLDWDLDEEEAWKPATLAVASCSSLVNTALSVSAVADLAAAAFLAFAFLAFRSSWPWRFVCAHACNGPCPCH